MHPKIRFQFPSIQCVLLLTLVLAAPVQAMIS